MQKSAYNKANRFISGKHDLSEPLVSIIIPVSEYHLEKRIHLKAVDSATHQTILCNVITYPDHQSKGAGYMRNMLVQASSRYKSPFIVFLDADDTIEPTFVEECLKAYQTGYYVHTAWTEGDKVFRDAPGKPHLVTTLYPTACFRALGGFDENLPGAEDIDFYWKSRVNGICGILLDKPLVHYTEHGRRSIEFDANPAAPAIRRMISERYENMACCGGEGQPAILNPGDEQPGDVLAVIMWNGNSNETSHFNNTRRYKGAGGQRIWVFPYDLENMRLLNGNPMFRRVVDAKSLAPERDEVLKIAGLS